MRLRHSACLLLLSAAATPSLASDGFCYYHGPQKANPTTYVTALFTTALEDRPEVEAVAGEDFRRYLVGKGFWRPQESGLEIAYCQLYGNPLMAKLSRQRQLDIGVAAKRAVVEVDFVAGRDKPAPAVYAEDLSLSSARELKNGAPEAWVEVEDGFFIDQASLKRDHSRYRDNPTPGGYPIEQDLVSFQGHRLQLATGQQSAWRSSWYVLDCKQNQLYFWARGDAFRNTPAQPVKTARYYKTACLGMADLEGSLD